MKILKVVVAMLLVLMQTGSGSKTAFEIVGTSESVVTCKTRFNENGCQHIAVFEKECCQEGCMYNNDDACEQIRCAPNAPGCFVQYRICDMCPSGECTNCSGWMNFQDRYFDVISGDQ